MSLLPEYIAINGNLYTRAASPTEAAQAFFRTYPLKRRCLVAHTPNPTNIWKATRIWPQVTRTTIPTLST